MSYNMLDDYPVLKFFAMAIVAVGAAVWTTVDMRALRGANRIRNEKAEFKPCCATNVETFLGPVKSITLTTSEGGILKFRPMDKQQALGLLGIKNNAPLSIARDPKGGPSAILKTPETEVIGFVRPE
ncbi:hypothetical protein L4X63_02495 [Geomonas sp. Red32]|uniref:hypothetical protein n=1 Tax=Geomonas sp. Red32 TaxID=2912856 RepID=UPI00202CD81E|nr:hypothetical protein [Geomonas sp. Red32]MCM0080450.1 hypothetical protein [Geomonas sp. Red32]